MEASTWMLGKQLPVNKRSDDSFVTGVYRSCVVFQCVSKVSAYSLIMFNDRLF